VVHRRLLLRVSLHDWETHNSDRSYTPLVARSVPERLDGRLRFGGFAAGAVERAVLAARAAHLDQPPAERRPSAMQTNGRVVRGEARLRRYLCDRPLTQLHRVH